MFTNKAKVSLYKENVAYGYRPTIFIGIESESGPSKDSLKLLNNLNDLYKYFNSFERSESYLMAEFCLLKGFKVLAQRVSSVTGPSSCRKFELENGEHAFFSPSKGVDYSLPSSSPFVPKIQLSQALYSYTVSFPNISEYEQEINPKFMISIPKFAYTASNELISQPIVMFGKDWNDKELYNIEYDTTRSKFIEEPIKGPEFRDAVLSFLSNNCNFEVSKIEGTETYFILSRTDISGIKVQDCVPEVEGAESIIRFEPSQRGLEENWCREYDKYKTVTFYSKVDSSINDLTVKVSKPSNTYYVDIYKFNSEGTSIFSEYFELKDLDELNGLSELVEVEIHDSSKDLTGTYNLKGRTTVIERNDYNKSIDFLKEISGDYSVDICIDYNYTDIQSVERDNYLRALQAVFPNSLILTDSLSLPSEEMIVQINPDVVYSEVTTFGTREYKLKGLSYLLYLLPNYSAGRDDSLLRIEDNSVKNSKNMIVEGDYGVSLIGVETKLDSSFPIKSLLSIVCAENLIKNLDFSKLDGSNQSYSAVNEEMSRVNEYLGTTTQVSVIDYYKYNDKVQLSLSFKADKFIIKDYQVISQIIW